MKPTKSILLSIIVVANLILAFCTMTAHAQSSEDFGHLQLTCESGVKIYLDGTFRGVTEAGDPALIIQKVPAGRRNLRADKDGFQPYEVQISIEKDSVVKHDVKAFLPDIVVSQTGDKTQGDISRKIGAIMIQTLPIDCNISIPTLGIDRNEEAGWKRDDKWSADPVPTGQYPAELMDSGGRKMQVIINVYPEKRTKLMINFLDNTTKIEFEPRNKNSIVQLETITNSVGMKLARVPFGKFEMGTLKGDPDEIPQRTVNFPIPFFMSLTEVTQQQWQKVMNNNPSQFKGPDLPVEMVSWNEATEFCQKLSELGNEIYRLPTEAEWEYVCRAGKTSEFFWGDEFDFMYAVTSHDSGGKTKTVATLATNDWGFSDMAGNVWEWCQDWYDEYDSKQTSQPTGPANGRHKVLRGGSWFSDPQRTRSANRVNSDPEARLNYVGFRVVMESKP